MQVILDRRSTGGMAMGPWMHSSNWDGWGWMAGWHVLGWALTVALVIGVVILITRSGSTRNARTSAEAILAERYARGEIDTEEFETRRQALR